MRRTLWISLALAALTVVLYAPVLRCQFLTFDDQAYVTENRLVRAGLTLHGIEMAFRVPTAGNWHPLTMLSHMLDCQIYGLRPWGHHLTNVLFHAANSVLLFLLLARMTGALWRSALVAGLFVIHPSHVESVAWVAERKDVLSSFFLFLALGAYLRYVKKSNGRRVVSLGVVLLFALALMAKSMAVTLPFLLLLLDFWPLGRVRTGGWSGWRPLIVEKWPLLGLSAIWCVVTIWAQGIGQAVATSATLPIAERIIHTPIAYLTYMRLLVFPWHLSAYYPYHHQEPVLWGIGAAAALALITWLALVERGRRPYLAVGWLWFLGMLVPVIGLVQVGGQAWADRYVYLPSIGLFLIVVWGGAEWAARHPSVKLFIPAAGAALVAVTAVELHYWKDTATLFRRAMEVTSGNYLAMTLVGSMEADQGKLDEAISLYRQAVALKPIYPEAHFFLGRALERKKQTQEAMAEFQQALRLRPDFDSAHVMVGLLLAQEQEFDQAIAHYQAALKANPESAAAESDWGMVEMREGHWTASVAHYEKAVRLDPEREEAHNNLGIGYLQTGRIAEGIRELREALKLNPGNTETRYNLGQALNQQGQWAEAEQWLHPLAQNPGANDKVQFQEGLALEHLGKTRDAQSHYAAALLQKPDFPEALQHLAWIAATDARPELRNGAQAVELAARACELTGQTRPAMLLTLSAAYAEAGRFPDALASVSKAGNLAKSQGQGELQAQAERLRAFFAAGQPFHGQAQ
jgi:tetratricopeptide (TPR) repeat protein